MDGLVSMPCRERDHEFLFSVIVPVYKTEEYVAETLESVINQTIGFEKNIQLILVNSDTPDNAGAICEKYLTHFPKNIVYVKLSENTGPSRARNAGLPYVTGKYVNFLDSDDKWALDAFEIAADFLTRNEDQVTVAICRKRYFDAWDGWFFDDAHYHTTRICSIWREPETTQFWITSGFYRADIFSSLKFDEKLRYAEDMKFISEVLMRCGQYGLIREAVFYYRRRASENLSLVQMKYTVHSWYKETIERSDLYIMQQSEQRWGKVIPYIQYVIMQEIAWRIPQESFPPDFSEEDIVSYHNSLKMLLEKIDDYVIATTPNLWREYKLACLRLKYGNKIEDQFECRKGRLVFHNLSWCRLDETSILTIMEQHVEDGCLLVDGKINIPFTPKNYLIFAKDNYGNYFPVKEYPGDNSNVRKALGVPCLVKRCFRVSIPLNGILSLSFIIRWGEIERTLNPSYGKFAKLTKRLKNSYFIDGDYFFTRLGSAIAVAPATVELRRRQESAVRDELRRQDCKRAFLLRTVLPYAKKALGGKQLWLISDRITRAKDNGEYLFRYLRQHPQPNVTAYFAISKTSEDYPRMKQIGKVVAVESFKYQLLFLLADYILSSTWGYAVEDPYGWHRDLIRDLFHYRYIYLDHALTKDDMSHEMNKHMRNFAMWTTGAQRETESILQYSYGYSEDVPQTTGLARYDAIYPAIDTPPQKMILIAPTWRKGLTQGFDKNGIAQYSTTFVESDFFHFYNTLINDERLLMAMRQKGYRGTLKLHPIISLQDKDFSVNDVFSLQEKTESYEQGFFENALIVTDYSSIAMDYAYIKRPVIYAQFDKDEFYLTHSYHENYFDYEQDGFGPVCSDYESTLKAILYALEKECKMEEPYLSRRKAFFAHIDDKNCERICKTIQWSSRKNLKEGRNLCGEC